jgi:hypothetical protein
MFILRKIDDDEGQFAHFSKWMDMERIVSNKEGDDTHLSIASFPSI